MAIVSTVGEAGDNAVDDVQSVQTMLNDHRAAAGLPLIAVNGEVDTGTIEAIAEFQAAQGATGDGVFHLVGDDAVPLAQGQADGSTLAEACRRARDDCKAQANCDPAATLKFEKCTCWRGGTEEFTCVARCSCVDPVA